MIDLNAHHRGRRRHRRPRRHPEREAAAGPAPPGPGPWVSREPLAQELHRSLQRVLLGEHEIRGDRPEQNAAALAWLEHERGRNDLRLYYEACVSLDIATQHKYRWPHYWGAHSPLAMTGTGLPPLPPPRPFRLRPDRPGCSPRRRPGREAAPGCSRACGHVIRYAGAAAGPSANGTTLYIQSVIYSPVKYFIVNLGCVSIK